MSKVVLAAAVVFTATMTAQVLGQGRQAVFPAQQRPPGDPASIERGKGIYVTTCTACHGADLRGGATGGPNLLRSQVVLSDQQGELILPIVHGARAERGMPPLPLPDDDVVAVAEYIHSVAGDRRESGRPAAERGAAAEPDRRRRQRRRGLLRGEVQQLPLPDRRPAGHREPRSRMARRCRTAGSPGAGAGGGGRGGRGRAGAGQARPVDPRAIIATVTLPSGEKVDGPGRAHRRLPRHVAAGRRHAAHVPPRRRTPEGRGQGSAGRRTRRCCRSSPTRTCTT